MKKLATVVIVCLVLVSVGCSNGFAFTHSKMLNEVVSSILQENYYEALDKCYRLERQVEQGTKGEVLFLEGVCLSKLEEYEQARAVFKKALSCIDKGELSQEVYLGIADTYFMENAFSQAIDIYEQLLVKYTEENYLVTLYYKLGKAYQKDSKWTKAEYYFNLLKNKFPDSLEAGLVNRADTGGNFFTIQVGCFTNEKNAMNLFSKLKNKGYEAYMTKLESKAQALYRVRVGKFISRVSAEYVERDLRIKENLPTHIFP